MNKLNQILLDNRNSIESSAEVCPFCRGENDGCEYFLATESRLGQLAKGSYQVDDGLTRELLEQVKERLADETVEIWTETGNLAIDLAKSLLLVKSGIGLYHILEELPLVGRIIQSWYRDTGLKLEDMELWWDQNFQIVFNTIAVSHTAIKEKPMEMDLYKEIFIQCNTAIYGINLEPDIKRKVSIFKLIDWGREIDIGVDFAGIMICAATEVLRLEDYVCRRLVDFEERILTQVDGSQYECSYWKEIRETFLGEWRDLTGALAKLF